MVAPASDVGTSDEDAGEDFIVSGTEDDQQLVSYTLSFKKQNTTTPQSQLVVSVLLSRPLGCPTFGNMKWFILYVPLNFLI